MALVLTLTEEDIDNLQRGDELDFFPTGRDPALTRGYFLGWRDYWGCFTSRDEQDKETIYEIEIKRCHLIPTKLDLLDVQDRATYICETLTLATNSLLFTHRDREVA